MSADHDDRTSIAEWRALRAEHAALYRVAGDSAAGETMTDLLLEIAATGIAWAAAEDQLAQVGPTGRMTAAMRATEAYGKHRAALARVRP